MNKKLGVITIGQSPRNDVVPEMIPYFGENVEVLEMGALDGLTYEEILEFKPEADDYVLVSKLKDGRSVKFAERYILPRLQKCIDKLEKKGADLILFICTGAFPDVFKSDVPIIYPQKILHSVVASLYENGNVVVITPDKDQMSQAKEKWLESGLDVKVISQTPYNDGNMSYVVKELETFSDVDVVAMDCIGYNIKMKNQILEKTGIPVVLARTIVARVIGEILE